MKNRAALPNRVGFYTLVMVAFSFIIYYMTVRGGRREIKYINNATDVVPYMQGVSKKGNPWLTLALCVNYWVYERNFHDYFIFNMAQETCRSTAKTPDLYDHEKVTFIHPVINVQ